MTGIVLSSLSVTVGIAAAEVMSPALLKWMLVGGPAFTRSGSGVTDFAVDYIAATDGHLICFGIGPDCCRRHEGATCPVRVRRMEHT